MLKGVIIRKKYGARLAPGNPLYDLDSQGLVINRYPISKKPAHGDKFVGHGYHLKTRCASVFQKTHIVDQV